MSKSDPTKPLTHPKNVPVKSVATKPGPTLQAQGTSTSFRHKCRECTVHNVASTSGGKGKAQEPASTSSVKEAVRNPTAKDIGTTIHPQIPYLVQDPKSLFKQRRAAQAVLHKLNVIPPIHWSQKQKASFEWANQVMNLYTPIYTLTNFPPKSVKRDGPVEVTSTPVAKKAKTTSAAAVASTSRQARQYNEVLKGQIIVAIVDRSDADGSIPMDKWRKLEARLASTLLGLLDDYPEKPPNCEDAGWYQGHVKLLACSDQWSLDLLKIAISRIGNLWAGARLEVLSVDQIPNRPKARIRLPIEPEHPKEILKLIRACNPKLSTKDWKIGRLEEPRESYRIAILVINEESLGLLEKADFKISYGFGKVPLKIYRKESDLSAPSTSGKARQEVTKPKIENSKNTTPSEMRTALSSEGVSNMFSVLDLDSDTEMEREPNKTKPLQKIDTTKKSLQEVNIEEQHHLLESSQDESGEVDVSILELPPTSSSA